MHLDRLQTRILTALAATTLHFVLVMVFLPQTGLAETSKESCGSQVRLDSPGGKLRDRVPYDQEDSSLCYATTAATAIDTFLPQTSARSSATALAIEWLVKDSGREFDVENRGGDPCVLIEKAYRYGACQTKNLEANELLYAQDVIEKAQKNLSDVDRLVEELNSHSTQLFSSNQSVFEQGMAEILGESLYMRMQPALAAAQTDQERRKLLYHEALRKEGHWKRAYDINVNEACRTLKSIAPGDDPTIFLNDWIQKYSSGEVLAMAVQNACPKKERVPVPRLQCVEVYNPTESIEPTRAEVQSRLLRYFESATVSKLHPLIATFRARVLNPALGPDETLNHAALIIGKRWNSKRNRCELLIFDSFGTNHPAKNDGFETENGRVWVSLDDFMNHLNSLRQVERVSQINPPSP